LLRKAMSNDFYQQLEIKRFGNEIVAPQSARLQMAVAASIRGNEQERNVVQPAHAFAESGEDIESSHLRHVYVAQDEIRTTRELSDSFDTIRGDNSLESLILQNLDQQVDGCGVILNA
jgi:hypothetical protein